MTQKQLLELFIPILIILPVLFFRLRQMSKPQPLKLARLWIRPAIILGLTALVLWAPQPGHTIRHFVLQDWAWLGLAVGLGGMAGWQWGRTMAIEVHPEDGTLMVKGSQAAMLALVVLILFRMGLRTGLQIEGKAWHLDVLLFSDALILFTASMFSLRAVEMYLRAKQVMGEPRHVKHVSRSGGPAKAANAAAPEHSEGARPGRRELGERPSSRGDRPDERNRSAVI